MAETPPAPLPPVTRGPVGATVTESQWHHVWLSDGGSHGFCLSPSSTHAHSSATLPLRGGLTFSLYFSNLSGQTGPRISKFECKKVKRVCGWSHTSCTFSPVPQSLAVGLVGTVTLVVGGSRTEGGPGTQRLPCAWPGVVPCRVSTSTHLLLRATVHVATTVPISQTGKLRPNEATVVNAGVTGGKCRTRLRGPRQGLEVALTSAVPMGLGALRAGWRGP